MKHFLISVVLLMVLTTCKSQSDLFGSWYGRVEFTGGSLRINFHLTMEEGRAIGTLESPDQNGAQKPFSHVAIDKNQVKLAIDSMNWEFSGKFIAEKALLEGVIVQGGQSFPIIMQREPLVKKTYNRPQTPNPPFPYRMEEVEIACEGHALSGTLTYPSSGGPFAAVVLVSGSGPQDRDETIAEHKPFWVIADFLTRKGYAVLRYDDRGTAKSTGEFKGATSADFSKDAEAVMRFLQKHQAINRHKIGLMGHSEGGMIAAMVAARNPEVDFVISLAGTGLAGKEVLRIQSELIAMASGMDPASAKSNVAQNQKLFSIALAAENPAKAESALRDYLKKEQPGMDGPVMERTIKMITDPWLLFFLAYNPASDWAKVKCPILAVNGSLDLQVTPDNLMVIANAANDGGNYDVTVESFAGLNHLFQSTASGSIDEYIRLEETFSERVLERIAEWMRTNVK